jgi:hypothetical protein
MPQQPARKLSEMELSDIEPSSLHDVANATQESVKARERGLAEGVSWSHHHRMARCHIS